MTADEVASVLDAVERTLDRPYDLVKDTGFTVVHRSGDLIVRSIASGAESAYLRLVDDAVDLTIMIGSDGGLGARCIEQVASNRAPAALALIADAMSHGDPRRCGLIVDGDARTVDDVALLLDGAIAEIASLHPHTTWGRAEYEWKAGVPGLSIGSEDRTDPSLPALPGGAIARFAASMPTHSTMRTCAAIPVVQDMLGGSTDHGRTVTTGPGMAMERRLDALSRLRCIEEGRKALSVLGIG